MDFLEGQKKGMESGFWAEEYREIILHHIESMYKTEVIREWRITDFLINGDKTLIKWAKRFQPLSKEDLKNKYGRDYENEK